MSKKSWIIPLIVLLAAAGLLFGIAGHWTGWQGSRPDQETDDAYLKAEVTPLSTRISGTVKRVNVRDYQNVKAGQTLIELEDVDYRATLMQAQAALAGSEANLEDNQATLSLPQHLAPRHFRSRLTTIRPSEFLPNRRPCAGTARKTD